MTSPGTTRTSAEVVDWVNDTYTGRLVQADSGAQLLTYRQLDYWCTSEWLGKGLVGGPGSGRQRKFDERTCEVILLMAKLVWYGFKADMASRIAGHLIARDEDSYALSGELVLLYRKSRQED